MGTSTPNDIWNSNSYGGANVNAKNNYWGTTDHIPDKWADIHNSYHNSWTLKTRLHTREK